MNHIDEHAAKVEVVTGLLYVESEPEDLHAYTVDTSFNQFGEKELCPGNGVLGKINAALQ